MHNEIVEPAADVGETCVFTDGAYSHGDDQSDKGTGMALLVWRGPDKQGQRKLPIAPASSP